MAATNIITASAPIIPPTIAPTGVDDFEEFEGDDAAVPALPENLLTRG